ncbi:hypothetical protein JCM24511_05677 [Saitozyma sp. JCM 24511]|nr:hypothetical protein JCM24511_05677 [Saitozyma sp. JCM 24511]
MSAPGPSSGQRLASHPDVLRSILSLCDRPTLVCCLRVSSALFDQSGPLLYRVLDLSTRNHKDIPKVFLGADLEAPVNPKAESLNITNFKRQLIGYVKELYLPDAGNLCNHPAFQAACRSMSALDHLHFSLHHFRLRSQDPVDCALTALVARTVSISFNTIDTDSLDGYRKLTSAAETLSIIPTGPIDEFHPKIAAIIDKIRCPGMNRLLSIDDPVMHVLYGGDSEQYQELLRSHVNLAVGCIKLGIEVYFLGKPKVLVCIAFDGGQYLEPDHWITLDRLNKHVARGLERCTGTECTSRHSDSRGSIGSIHDFFLSGMDQSVARSLSRRLRIRYQEACSMGYIQ